MSIFQDIFELKCVVKNIKIRLCSRIESGVKQLLAVVTCNNDIVLYYNYGELVPIIKRIPWLIDSNKIIECICFDPSAAWLLVVCIDGSLYIIPALSLVDKKQKVDCKWSLNDCTHFPKPPQTPDSKPTASVWWQTLDCNQNALVGYQNGCIALISLTDGRCLGCCSVNDSIHRLYLCQDNTLDMVSLLINGENGQQWRLMLEQNSIGCLWPPDLNSHTDDTQRSRLSNLKQISVDKFVSLKQRFVDVRNNRRDSSQSDTNSDTSSTISHNNETTSNNSNSNCNNNNNNNGPELLPCLCDTIFSPQYAKNRYLFTAFYKPTNLLTVHTIDVESAPLYVYKLTNSIQTLLLTDRLIYTINDDFNRMMVISSQLSESRIEGDSEFNPDALIAQFDFTNERILQIFKSTDLTIVRSRKHKHNNNGDENNKKHYELPNTIDDIINLYKLKIDTCVIVTDKSIYEIHIKYSPIEKYVKLITEKNDFINAEKLSIIFSLNQQQLLECCGDLLITKGQFHSGIILYKQAKVHLLKRVLKLAITADCRTLLKFVHLCLTASKVDMSMTTKIHIGNLAVMAYTELILRYGGQARISNTKDFMNFLRYEEFYDQILAVNVAVQAGHWNIVGLLAKSRGLQPEVIAALSRCLRHQRPTDYEFLLTLSEPCLNQSLLIYPNYSQEIFRYIRHNIDMFPLEILQRFAIQLDPSQPSVLPLVSRLFQQNNKNDDSSFETTIDSIDFDNPDKAVIICKDLIETFLFVIVVLVGRIDRSGFNIELLEKIPIPPSIIEMDRIKNLPDFHPLSCGYEHAAIVRNSNLYTMGVSSAGCLGLGPLLTQSSPPKLIQTLADLKVKVLSVSCGRKHTLALTDFGVYAWGSNNYGQLGLGPYVHETPYPQMITALSYKIIIEIVAGQYHSLALTSNGQVYTWGWGIHGQLGHNNCDNLFYPKLLDFNQQVIQITAGHAHSLLLTNNGKLYGFGSNAFGQLETCRLDTNKSTKPIWVLLMSDMYTPIEKVTTAYFHNIAVTADQEVYTWGASPQDVRILQSKNLQKQNGLLLKNTESWRSSVHIYSGGNQYRSIEQISVGYRHSAILHQGHILWNKNKDDELSPPKLRDQDNISFLTQKFLYISCGLDYTMAIDQSGKLLAWGSPTMAQTILGKHYDNDDNKKNPDNKIIVFKNTKRLIKLSNNLQNSDNFPVEIPGLPTMEITFNPTDHRLLFMKNLNPFTILRIENSDVDLFKPVPKNFSLLNLTQDIPRLKFGQKTLHYILETYHGLYDSENILLKCLSTHNYQAASKIAILNGHFCDSLSFQLTSFKKYMDTIGIDLDSIFVNKEAYDVKEKEQDFVEFVVKNIQDDFNEKNLQFASSKLNTPERILSPSSSLDSIQQWSDDIEHQGGCESPCELSNDIRQNISHYVQSVKTTNEPITNVTKHPNNDQFNSINNDNDLEIKDEKTRMIIQMASKLIEFYIKKIYISENHILMQNVLMKCIEFWLNNNLPVPILENILLKNMDKYFYPLSILLFCKNFNNDNDDDDIIRKQCDFNNKKNSASFLKEFSTKFCLQLCSMVLDNVNKA